MRQECLATVSGGFARDIAIIFLRVIGLARLLVEVVRVGAPALVDLLTLQFRRGILDAWRGDRFGLGIAKSETVDNEVDVARVGFILEALGSDSDNPVKDAYFVFAFTPNP